MTIQTRRERERAERERLIVTAARELAEAEGWDAVTTRRLAEEIEYSQPVLYSHFKGKGAIMAAVAVQGCADLAEEMRAARTAAGSPREDTGLLTETYWAGLHGLVTLMRSGRLPEEAHEQRLALLIGHFVPPGTS